MNPEDMTLEQLSQAIDELVQHPGTLTTEMQDDLAALQEERRHRHRPQNTNESWLEIVYPEKMGLSPTEYPATMVCFARRPPASAHWLVGDDDIVLDEWIRKGWAHHTVDPSRAVQFRPPNGEGNPADDSRAPQNQENEPPPSAATPEPPPSLSPPRPGSPLADRIEAEPPGEPVDPAGWWATGERGQTPEGAPPVDLNAFAWDVGTSAVNAETSLRRLCGGVEECRDALQRIASAQDRIASMAELARMQRAMHDGANALRAMREQPEESEKVAAELEAAGIASPSSQGTALEGLAALDQATRTLLEPLLVRLLGLDGEGSTDGQ